MTRGWFCPAPRHNDRTHSVGKRLGAEARLVPEVSIGELDGPDEYLFGRIGSLAVDNDRNVYVFDAQAHHVRVFERCRRLRRNAGRERRGTGRVRPCRGRATVPG